MNVVILFNDLIWWVPFTLILVIQIVGFLRALREEPGARGRQ